MNTFYSQIPLDTTNTVLRLTNEHISFEKKGIFTWIKAWLYKEEYKLVNIVSFIGKQALTELDSSLCRIINEKITKYNAKHLKSPISFDCNLLNDRILQPLNPLSIRGEAAIEPKNEYGETPLMEASLIGCLEDVKCLISKGANIEAKDIFNETPLMKACRRGHLEVVKFLISKGANIEAKDNCGETPLMKASLRGHSEVVKFLISKGATIEAKDNCGETPLMKASLRGHSEVVKFLISKGATIEAKDNNGNTPLMKASLGHLEVVKYLISKGATIEAKNNNGNTPLILASWNGHLEVVKYLISKGATIEAKNNNGNTPLILASWNCPLEVVKFLVNKGANIEAKNNDGTTPLMEASHMGRLEVVKFLISQGATIEATNIDSWTPLTFASSNGKLAAVQLLNAKGANIEGQGIGILDKHHITPLMQACANGHKDVINYLLDHGAEIEAKDHHGHTALIHAVTNNQLASARLLLDRGTSIDTTAFNGWTPLMFAASEGKSEMVALLLEKGAFYNESVFQLLFERNAHFDASLIQYLLENIASNASKICLYRGLREGRFDPSLKNSLTPLQLEELKAFSSIEINPASYDLKDGDDIPRISELIVPTASDLNNDVNSLWGRFLKILTQDTEKNGGTIYSREALKNGLKALIQKAKKNPGQRLADLLSHLNQQLAGSGDSEFEVIDRKNTLIRLAIAGIDQTEEKDLQLLIRLNGLTQQMTQPAFQRFCEQAQLKDDNDRLIPFDKLTKNLRTFFNYARTRQFHKGTPPEEKPNELKAFYEHLGVYIQWMADYLQASSEPLILANLSIASSECGGRWIEELTALYSIYHSGIEGLSIPAKLKTAAVKQREGIIQKLSYKLMSKQNPHTIQQYKRLIGKEFGIPGAQIAEEIKDPFVDPELTQEIARENFLDYYSLESVVFSLRDSLRSFERELLIDYLKEMMPDTWEPDAAMDERIGSYLESCFEKDSEGYPTNTLTIPITIEVLTRAGILQFKR